MEEDVIKCPVNMAKNTQPKSYDKKDYKEMPGSQLKNTFFFSGFREA